MQRAHPHHALTVAVEVRVNARPRERVGEVEAVAQVLLPRAARVLPAGKFSR